MARIVAATEDGLRHGYFDYRLTGEVIGGGDRRVTLYAGKTHQLLVAGEDCERQPSTGRDRQAFDPSAHRDPDHRSPGFPGKPHGS
jgi:hypothetical protein